MSEQFSIDDILGIAEKDDI